MKNTNSTNAHPQQSAPIISKVEIALAAALTFGWCTIGGAALLTLRDNLAFQEDDVARMQSSSLDEQIDNFYLKKKAFLDCRTQFEARKHAGIANVKPPYRSIEDGLVSKPEIVKAIREEGCHFRYGLRPTPFCGYGDCWAVALLIISLIAAA